MAGYGRFPNAEEVRELNHKWRYRYHARRCWNRDLHQYGLNLYWQSWYRIDIDELLRTSQSNSKTDVKDDYKAQKLHSNPIDMMTVNTYEQMFVCTYSSKIIKRGGGAGFKDDTFEDE